LDRAAAEQDFCAIANRVSAGNAGSSISTERSSCHPATGLAAAATKVLSAKIVLRFGCLAFARRVLSRVSTLWEFVALSVLS
jgi:hypothetical protein